MGNILEDGDHWRARAAEARAQANDVSIGPARDSMLKIAAEYEYLAERADQRLGRLRAE